MGVVTDVLRGHDTASGLRIEIQLLHFDPSAPYRKKIVDHDDVVEHRSVGSLLTKSQYLICLLQALDLHFWSMQSPETFSFSLQRPT
jgi:hypothetical protein